MSTSRDTPGTSGDPSKGGCGVEGITRDLIEYLLKNGLGLHTTVLLVPTKNQPNIV